MIEQLRAQMRALLDEREQARTRGLALVQATEGDNARTLSDAENAELRAAEARVAEIDSELAELDVREAELVAQESRDSAAAALRARIGAPASGDPDTRLRTGSEPSAYRKEGARDEQGRPVSYFRDLYDLSKGRGTRAVQERMERNAKELRAVSTAAGSADELVPPVWMMQDFVEVLRADRIVANAIGFEQMPAGTDSWSLPKGTTGTSVAVQSSQNTTLSETDYVTGSVTAVPLTLGGLSTVSVQLLEQSPLNVDTIIFNDLRAEYARVTDATVITNTTTSAKGLLNQASPVAVTYTDASPTLGELFPKIADAIQQVHTGRFAPPTCVFMHPRRWGWATAALDTVGRPLVSQYDNPSAIALARGIASQGLVGEMQGLPVYVDANIPTNLGGSTNEDRILICRCDDLKLWESAPKVEVFRETLAKQASVVFRLYAYFAQMHNRWDKSVAVISGTGLATPTF